MVTAKTKKMKNAREFIPFIYDIIICRTVKIGMLNAIDIVRLVQKLKLNIFGKNTKFYL
jgi:hypothetical protein